MSSALEILAAGLNAAGYCGNRQSWWFWISGYYFMLGSFISVYGCARTCIHVHCVCAGFCCVADIVYLYTSLLESQEVRLSRCPGEQIGKAEPSIGYLLSLGHILSWERQIRLTMDTWQIFKKKFGNRDNDVGVKTPTVGSYFAFLFSVLALWLFCELHLLGPLISPSLIAADTPVSQFLGL